jgi:hypothetical protein
MKLSKTKQALIASVLRQQKQTQKAEKLMSEAMKERYNPQS